MLCFFLGDNIGVVQNASHVMLNNVKHLAECTGKVPARDPSFLRMTTILIFKDWTTAILLPFFMYKKGASKCNFVILSVAKDLVGTVAEFIARCFTFVQHDK